MSNREAVTAVRLQVMWTRLIALVEEQAQTLLRTAFSPIVRESGDLSAGIFDVHGRMLAQAVTGTPGHINTMARSVGYFIERFPVSTMAPGDVFVTNDPWHGTGHLNDYVVVTPAFRAGRPIALFACTGHMTDVGGIGLSPDGGDLFAEGVAVPIMKLIDAGRVNETLISIAKANSRLPHEIEGDIYSLVASNETAIRRLAELLAEVGASDIDALADFIVERSRRAIAERIAALPKDEATWSMSVDGFEAPVHLRARLRIAEDTIGVDWSGTSQASRFGINVPLNYAAAYTSYALACAVAPDIPNNAGTLSAFEVSAPPGCILNAQRPQPVACRHIIGGLLPDVVFGCLDQIVPGRVPAESASALWTLTFRGGRPPGFTISIVTNGGTGARADLDGLSATSFPSAVRGTPVEIVEAATPLVFWRRELRAGSGGEGAARGGLGQDMEIGTLDGAPFTLFAAFDRIAHPARGRAGGNAGAAGELALRSGRALAGKGAHRIEPTDRLIVRTPGGGGYGDPDRRPQAARAADRLAGYASTSGSRAMATEGTMQREHGYDRRRFIGMLATGALAAGSRPASAQDNRLVIPTYGGRYERFWREALIPPFEQKTGVQTVLDIGLGANFATKLRASGPDNPPYSYLMANELVGAVLRSEGFFEPWPAEKVPNLAKIHPKANPGNQGVTVMFSPIGIAYRKDLVKTPPRSWKDLWDSPDIKGKVGLYEITNTAGFMFLMMTSKIYGSGPMDLDVGFRQVERLKPFPEAGLAGALAVLLTRGEVVAGPLDFGETLSMQKKGIPVAWAAPAEGMFMFDQTFSLLKKGPNKSAACAFLDHMLSEDVQAKLAGEFSGVPVNRNVKLPPDQQPLTVEDLDKIVAFDWVAANKVKDSVIERWNRMTRG